MQEQLSELKQLVQELRAEIEAMQKRGDRVPLQLEELVHLIDGKILDLGALIGQEPNKAGVRTVADH